MIEHVPEVFSRTVFSGNYFRHFVLFNVSSLKIVRGVGEEERVEKVETGRRRGRRRNGGGAK